MDGITTAIIIYSGPSVSLYLCTVETRISLHFDHIVYVDPLGDKNFISISLMFTIFMTKLLAKCTLEDKNTWAGTLFTKLTRVLSRNKIQRRSKIMTVMEDKAIGINEGRFRE